MSNWPNLRRAPIVEGLIDFQVVPAPAITLQTLKECAESLAADFPAREELQQFSTQFSFSAAEGASFTAHAPAPLGIMLRSADGRWAAQFRLNGFTMSRLEPYTSWKELKQRAEELWIRYREAAQPQRIVRIATRYINRISLSPGDSLDRTFSTTFNI